MLVPNKRAADEAAARPNKRARQRDLKRSAHQIAVQQHHVDVSQSELASTSGSRLHGDEDGAKQAAVASKASTIRLPSQLQADKQLAKYAFEAQSLLKAIKNSSVGSSVRAWQLLPRHKRRRNASHNLLALPKRLRAKGRSELRASNTIPRSRADVRRRKGKGDRGALGAYPRRKEGKRRSALVERATQAIVAKRAWLETHLWHAKRFRMSARQAKIVAGQPAGAPERWGYSLAEESSAKSFRSSWRDDKKAVTVLDRSYEAWFRVSATVRRRSSASDAADALAKVLQRCGLLHGWQDEWHDGRRLCDTILTAPVREPTSDSNPKAMDMVDKDGTELALRARTPLRVIWIPVRPNAVAEEGTRGDQRDAQPDSNRRNRREVLLSTHPACAAQVERVLRQSVVPALRVTELHARLNVARLNSVPHPFISAGSGALGRRHASAAIRNASDTKEATAARKFTDMFERALQSEWKRHQAYNMFEVGGPSAGALLAKVLVPVRGASENTFVDAVQDGKAADGDVVALDVHDPRLSFPPRSRLTTKKGRKGDDDMQSSNDKSDGVSSLLAHGAAPPRYSSGEIQSRRATLPTPGARLLPTSRDDKVPVVLLRRASTTASGWTLLVPRGWGKAFWLSLVHPGTRVLGQLQLHALRFDKGKPTFPYDWVGTPAYDQVEEDEAQRVFQAWLRTPPAKRCNFDRTGARWPFGGHGMWLDVVRNGIAIATNATALNLGRPPWLFALHDESSHGNACALDRLVDVWVQWTQAGRATTPIPEVLRAIQCAVLCVRVTACRKGSFAKWDEVHSITSSTGDDRRSAWLRALTAVQADGQQRQALQRLEQRTPVDPATQIGTVTTSHFSLSNGKGVALAAISLLAYLDIVARQQADDKPRQQVSPPLSSPLSSRTAATTRVRNPIVVRNIVLIRSVKGGPFRAASVEPVSLQQ